MKRTSIWLFIAIVLIGILLAVFGEHDDSWEYRRNRPIIIPQQLIIIPE